MKIAALLTCFNRKDKTLSCLTSLYQALCIYNNKVEDKVELSIYLTDDGCTDGTGYAVRDNFSDKNITILKGTGNLYWAGGMRFAWNEALKKHNEWDFYLLLNDDTDLLDNLFEELLNTHKYCIENYKQSGIYSGITSSKSDHNKMTYGGDIWKNKFLGTSIRLKPIGKPQLCDITNANILLVSKEVVDEIGIFWKGYTHGRADNDYSNQARKKGIPVLLTANFCGRCDNDHKSQKEIADIVKNMSLSERKKYFSHPIRSNNDYLKYIRRNMPLRYPMVYLGRILNVYFPKFYYRINNTIR